MFILNNINFLFNYKIGVLNVRRCNMSKLKSANIEDECMVCYENKKMYYTSCNRHYICIECSVKLFEKKCPMCRQ